MDRKDKGDELGQIGKLTAGSIGSVALGLVLSVAFSFIAKLLFGDLGEDTLTAKVVSTIGMSLFFACVMSDPVGAWVEKKPLWQVGVKFVLGMLASVGLLLAIANTGKDKMLPGWAFVVGPLLLMPILFGSFAAERFLKNTKAPLDARVWDAIIEYVDTSGPVIMMAVMGVAMLFYWLVDMPIHVLVPFIATIVLGITIYCSAFYDGVEPPLADGETGEPIVLQPRSKSLGEALSKVLDVSVRMLPGVLVMTGLIYVAMSFWDIETFKIEKGQELEPLTQIIWPLIKASVVAMVVVPGGMMAATLVGGLGVTGWAYVRGMDFSETKMRADKFAEMIYGGAMGKLFHSHLEARKD
jgi:hypothetical protein